MPSSVFPAGRNWKVNRDNVPERYASIVFNHPLNRSFTYKLKEDQFDLCPGWRVRVKLRGKEENGYILNLCSHAPKGVPPEKILPVLEPSDGFPVLNTSLIELSRFMTKYYCCSPGEACAMISPPAGTSEPRKKKEVPGLPHSELPVLTSDQSQVYETIINSQKTDPRPVLLQGVTGSGKTLVYFYLIRDAIRQGRQAVYLIPEIALTEQTINLIKQYFPSDRIALLHSRLTPSARREEWKAVSEGRRDLIIGPRSAVFAPCPDPGIIILDEEHSSSYKEHARPTYHARQIAFARTRANKSLLVLGSATPSIETKREAENGRFLLVRLDHRYKKLPVPSIRFLNHDPSGSPMHEDLIRSVRERLDKKEQVILFHNLRGFSRYYVCNSCGYMEACPNCGISLTYHKVVLPVRLVCHYCGFNRTPALKCPECGSNAMFPSGSGTQKVEVVLQKIFPKAIVERFDMDSTRRKKEPSRIYTDFLNGKIDILVGTQMVAKGLHFPNVTLVGVIGFDFMVNLPDFRSFETTFSLLLQVFGRTGRSGKPGEVVVQTRDNDHPLLKYLADQDYDRFYADEVKIREDLGYPPFRRLVRILTRSPDREKAEKAIQEISQELRKLGKSSGNILGPVPAPLPRLNNRYRFHILLKIPYRNAVLNAFLTDTLFQWNKGGVYIELDIDPQSLL